MQAELQADLAFHLTGQRSGDQLDPVGGLVPALFAGYRDLTRLRYDFPLVLVRDGTAETSVQSLSGLFDRVLDKIAGGDDGERLRKHALRLERELRTLVGEGATGSLRALSDAAASRLSAHNDELFQDSLRRLRGALDVDGEVVDCDKTMPFRLLRHAWQALNDRKAHRFRAEIDRLVMRLSNILAAEFVRSDAGLSEERLKASVGGPQQEAFDFAALSRLLAEASPQIRLPESRRRRIERLLAVLTAQRFFPAAGRSDAATDPVEPYDFVFESCAEATKAYCDRTAPMTALAKAMAMAELEIEGRYNGAKHDQFFADFGRNGLDPRELALFPDYLICVGTDEVSEVLKALSAGLPAKVLVQTDDLLQPVRMGGEHVNFALGSRQLASTAIGFSTFYVLQSASSNLFQLREQIFRGLAYSGPALFNVFSGATEATDLPPYLTAAAAMESRAFPTFVYDPSAGPDLASRFDVQHNPQPDADWPAQSLAYEDEAHQKVSETLPFTILDFVACDRRYGENFARVPRAKWNGSMAPASEFLSAEPRSSDKVPCLLMVDRNTVLQKVIVTDWLLREAQRCVEMWRSLQELGGIHNSHAARLLARERKAWEEQSQREPQPNRHGTVEAAPEPAAAAAAAVAVAAVAAPMPAGEPSGAERSSDDPYIETARCTTCNECTLINDKMFAYDANKQASIVNPDAGTYRQLVEAAESCQVSIIHPGKPRNPNEPGLEELLKRAEPFL